MGDGRIYLNNSLFITGSGGTGKTNVVSNFAWRLDPRKDTKVIVSAPTSKQLEKLKTDISRGKSENVDSSTKGDLMRKLLGDNYESFKEALESLQDKSEARETIDNTSILDGNGNQVITVKSAGGKEFGLHNDFLEKLTFPFSKEHDTVVYLDEVSWFSPIELAIMNHIASMKGSTFYFVGLGDELQNGHSLNEDTPFSLDTFYYTHPPKLKSVIRAKNIHKQNNTESLEISLKNRVANIINPERFSTIPDVTLNYNDDIFLNGDKIVSELTVVDLRKLDPSQEIAVITDNGTLVEEYKSLFEKAGLNIDKLQILAKDNIQGEEFDQVVSLFNIKYNKDKESSLYNANKQLYTLLSRGKVNTLVVGNEELLKDSNIIPERKDTTSSVELRMEQIDDLLQRRLEALGNIEYAEDEEVDDKALEIEDEADLHENATPDVENNMTDNLDGERQKMSQDDYDGNNTYLTYSFYNMLNARVEDGELDVNDMDGVTMSDLQFLSEISPAIKEAMTSQELINDFIIAKNHLLHNIKIPNGNIFQDSFEKFTDGKLVVRKIVQNEYTRPYGKQVHMTDDQGQERDSIDGKSQLFLALKTTFNNSEGVGIDGYVTLAALPDLTNDNWTQVENKAFLTTISSRFDEGVKDVEIEANINPLTGIRTIFSTGTSKKGGEAISISGETMPEFKKNLTEAMPGLLTTDLNTLQVFDDNEDNIKKEFAETGYNLDTEKPALINAKNFRFRSFIKVSYINANDNSVSKLMVFQTKKRSLLDAKKEYDNIKKEYEENKGNKVLREQYRNVEFPALIAKWNGVVLLSDILKFYENDKEFDPATNSTIPKSEFILNEILMMTISTGSQIEQLETFEKMVDIIKKSGYDPSNINNDDRKILLGGIKGSTRISNLGLRVLDVLTEDEISEFSENYEAKNGQYDVYYNPLWRSLHKDSHEKEMDSKFIKYLELNAYLEPPIFKTELIKVIESVDKVIEPEENVPPVDDDLIIEDDISILKATEYYTPFTFNGNRKTVPVDLSTLGTEKKVHMTVSAVTSALEDIQSRIGALDSNIGEKIQNLLLTTIPTVIGNPTLFTDSGRLNANGANLNYKNVVENAEVFEEIEEYFDDRYDDLKDYFLTSRTINVVTDIDEETNKKLCK
jgi:hypothetical protein